jgi:hypothetical protein
LKRNNPLPDFQFRLNTGEPVIGAKTGFEIVPVKQSADEEGPIRNGQATERPAAVAVPKQQRGSASVLYVVDLFH